MRSIHAIWLALALCCNHYGLLAVFYAISA